MKNPWEYMSTKPTANKKKSEKNNDSQEETSDGSRPDDPPVLKIIKVVLRYLMVITIEFTIVNEYQTLVTLKEKYSCLMNIVLNNITLMNTINFILVIIPSCVE